MALLSEIKWFGIQVIVICSLIRFCNCYEDVLAWWNWQLNVCIICF